MSASTGPAAGKVADTDGLVDLLLGLLAVPSPTGEEAALADWLAARYADEEVHRHGDSLVVGSPDASRPQVLLVGHTDTVPATEADREPRREGDRVVGRGTSDMKGGLAVAMAAFEDPQLRDGPYGLRLVAYAGEEGPHAGNELGPLLDAVGDLNEADLAIVLEPTDGEVQLGCLGALNAHVSVAGVAAHSARPWHGENALGRLAPLLAELTALPARDVRVDDLTFREVVTPTQAWTDNARNVVPDRVTVNVNVRFAPDKDADAAEDRLRRIVGDRGSVEVVDVAPPAPPHRAASVVARFVEAVGAPVRAKQAWTDVARFAERGVPALNYGPGATAQAHQRGEWVEVAALAHALEGVRRFLGA